MGKISKAVRAAKRAVDDMVNVTATDKVLVVADETAMENSHPEIVECILGLCRERGAESELIVMRDEQFNEENYLSELVQEAMHQVDVVFGCTRSTVASSYHHEIPRMLEEEGQIRTLGLVDRSWDALTGPHILEADFEANYSRAGRIMEQLEAGSEIHVTCPNGTDFTASIEDSLTRREQFARTPGDHAIFSGIGEADVGPEVGTAEGKAVIDGAVWLPDSPWPSPPLELTIKNGEIVSITGDEKIASDLRRIFEGKHNAKNLAEIGFGTNPYADMKELAVWKKRLGTLHLGVGDGLYYGQSVASPSHIDFVINKPSVEIDGEPLNLNR